MQHFRHNAEEKNFIFAREKKSWEFLVLNEKRSSQGTENDFIICWETIFCCCSGSLSSTSKLVSMDI